MPTAAAMPTSLEALPRSALRNTEVGRLRSSLLPLQDDDGLEFSSDDELYLRGAPRPAPKLVLVRCSTDGERQVVKNLRAKVLPSLDDIDTDPSGIVAKRTRMARIRAHRTSTSVGSAKLMSKLNIVGEPLNMPCATSHASNSSLAVPPRPVDAAHKELAAEQRRSSLQSGSAPGFPPRTSSLTAMSTVRKGSNRGQTDQRKHPVPARKHVRDRSVASLLEIEEEDAYDNVGVCEECWNDPCRCAGLRRLGIEGLPSFAPDLKWIEYKAWQNQETS